MTNVLIYRSLLANDWLLRLCSFYCISSHLIQIRRWSHSSSVRVFHCFMVEYYRICKLGSGVSARLLHRWLCLRPSFVVGRAQNVRVRAGTRCHRFGSIDVHCIPCGIVAAVNPLVRTSIYILRMTFCIRFFHLAKRLGVVDYGKIRRGLSHFRGSISKLL